MPKKYKKTLNKRSIIRSKCKEFEYPKIFKVSFKLGLFFTFYSSIVIILSIVFKDPALAVMGTALFFSGFGFVTIKLLMEERRVLSKLKQKKAK